MPPPRPRSSLGVLDVLGSHLMAIVTPVSVCMLLVVCLVRQLNPQGADDSMAYSVGELVYQEQSTDSNLERFEGALLNALVFVVFVTAITFVLVLLFYLRCSNFIWGYMAFSGFVLLAFMGGGVSVQIIEAYSIPIDVFTFVFMLYNFAVVGVMAMLVSRMPMFMTQSYLVIISTIAAFWFSHLPEWTTWLLLIAMSIYDLFAVLAPGGPLKLLLQIAIDRNEEIPALIYEARPNELVRPQTESASEATQQQRLVGRFERRVVAENDEGTAAANGAEEERVGLLQTPERVEHRGPLSSDSPNDSWEQSAIQIEAAGTEAAFRGTTGAASRTPDSATESTTMLPDDERDRQQSGSPSILRNSNVGDAGSGAREQPVLMPSSVKLGLGDFIFYSVLVGRAAMYDMLTAFASYLAIIAGLGATLVLLAVMRKALPALPISITLGVIFYFLTRILLEPFVVAIALNLTFV